MLGEIVYFDANATIREMMVSQLKTYGFEVIEVHRLSQCEAVLQRCNNPIILILDMTRQPDFLLQLQQFVPKYLNDPNRCILTTTKPTALAHYLPEDINACFFKHVIERPFKRMDFIRFLEDIIQPYRMVPELKAREVASISMMNSSISQIIDSESVSVPDPVAESFAASIDKQVESIVQDVSEVLPLVELDDLESQPKPPPPPQEPDSPPNVIQRLSRTSRARAASGRFSREPSWSRVTRESSQSNPSLQSITPQSPQSTRQSSGHRPSIAREIPISNEIPSHTSPSGIHPGIRETSRAQTDIFLSVGSATRQKSEQINNTAQPDTNAHASVSDDYDEEEENTILISSAGIGNMNHTPPKASSFPITEIDVPGVLHRLRLPILVQLLMHSAHFGFPMTIICQVKTEETLLLVHSGLVMWIETINNYEIMPAIPWLESHGYDNRLTIQVLKKKLSEGQSLNDALSSMNRDSLGIEICTVQIDQGLVSLSGLHDRVFRLYDGIPSIYKSLIQERPMYGINVIPSLFKKFREQQESYDISERFKNGCYVKRPYRAPLNASISLTKAETQLLERFKSPVILSDLSHDIPDAEAIAYRLVQFGFLDPAA